MYREDAVKKIKEITNGSGLDRTNFPENMKGSMAKRMWNSSAFDYGMEYGYILGLIEIFDIKVEELKNEPNE